MRDSFHIKLSAEERAMLEAIAERDGVTLAQAFRTMLLHQAVTADMAAVCSAPKVKA